MTLLKSHKIRRKTIYALNRNIFKSKSIHIILGQIEGGSFECGFERSYKRGLE